MQKAGSPWCIRSIRNRQSLSSTQKFWVKCSESELKEIERSSRDPKKSRPTQASNEDACSLIGEYKRNVLAVNSWESNPLSFLFEIQVYEIKFNNKTLLIVRTFREPTNWRSLEQLNGQLKAISAKTIDAGWPCAHRAAIKTGQLFKSIASKTGNRWTRKRSCWVQMAFLKAGSQSFSPEIWLKTKSLRMIKASLKLLLFSIWKFQIVKRDRTSLLLRQKNSLLN